MSPEIASTAPAMTQEVAPEQSVGFKLFPDFLSTPVEEGQVVEAPPAEAQTEEPATEEAPVVSDYLDIEQLKDKKVKTKVDGIEGEVTFADLLKGFQTDQHLTRKGQAIAEEKKALESIREDIFRRSTPEPEKTAPKDEDPVAELLKPYVMPYVDDIKALKEKVASLETTAQPLQYQRNIDIVDTHLKGQGYTDFKDKVAEIEKVVVQRNIPNPTIGDYIDTYKDLKIRELMFTKPPPPKEEAPPKVQVTKPIPKVESNDGASMGQEDWLTEHNRLFEEAQRTGDWTKLISFKTKSR